jgi:3-deoxy-7-phosphoheptulonate synthase
MRACGIDTESNPNLSEVDVYTSHEALILGYEEALTRQDSLTGGWFDCSAHMLWIGERTRELDGAHVEFLRGVANPIGCKIGPDTTPDFVLELCEALNPSRIPGRLTLITRMGADKIEDKLQPLLRVASEAGHPIVWACDPMHGNTFTSPSGRKTRHFDDIVREIRGFVRAHRAAGTWPGGIHVELTGENVTECLGGADALSDTDLDDRYETMCDPRLNARQSVDLAFRVAELVSDFT